MRIASLVQNPVFQGRCLYHILCNQDRYNCGQLVLFLPSFRSQKAPLILLHLRCLPPLRLHFQINIDRIRLSLR